MFIIKKHNLSLDVVLETTSFKPTVYTSVASVYTSVAPFLQLLKLDLSIAYSNASFEGLKPAEQLTRHVYGPMKPHPYVDLETLSTLVEISKCCERTKIWIREAVIPNLLDCCGPMMFIAGMHRRQTDHEFAVVVVTKDNVWCKAPEGHYFSQALRYSNFGEGYFELSAKFGYIALGKNEKMYPMETMTKLKQNFDTFSTTGDHDFMEGIYKAMMHFFSTLDNDVDVEGPKKACAVCLRDVSETLFVPRERCIHSFCNYCTARIQTPLCPLCRQ